MIETKYVIIRDEYLDSNEDSYPIAVYDDVEEALKAVHKAMQKVIDECNNGIYDCIGDYRVSSTRTWCRLQAEQSNYHIAFRLCCIPHNALEFD
jgi:hypothetical protein